jgi:hypothetical protein
VGVGERSAVYALAVSAHQLAARGSARLCDLLFDALRATIPTLARSQAHRWCGFYAPGRRRFAYVAHFKTEDRVEVWCRGDLSALAKYAPPRVRQRGKPSEGWAEDFKGRFDLRSASAIPAAARLLIAVSYPAS